MFNGLLVLLLFGLIPLAGRSQTVAALAATPDSATAIRQVFWQRRQAGLGVAVGCGPVAPGTGTTPPATSQLMLPPGAVAGLATNCSLLSFFSRMRFSARHEQEALQRLAQHRPLPGYVQRAIGPVLASK